MPVFDPTEEREAPQQSQSQTNVTEKREKSERKK